MIGTATALQNASVRHHRLNFGISVRNDGRDGRALTSPHSAATAGRDEPCQPVAPCRRGDPQTQAAVNRRPKRCDREAQNCAGQPSGYRRRHSPTTPVATVHLARRPAGSGTFLAIAETSTSPSAPGAGPDASTETNPARSPAVHDGQGRPSVPRHGAGRHGAGWRGESPHPVRPRGPRSGRSGSPSTPCGQQAVLPASPCGPASPKAPPTQRSTGPAVSIRSAGRRTGGTLRALEASGGQDRGGSATTTLITHPRCSEICKTRRDAEPPAIPRHTRFILRAAMDARNFGPANPPEASSRVDNQPPGDGSARRPIHVVGSARTMSTRPAQSVARCPPLGGLGRLRPARPVSCARRTCASSRWPRGADDLGNLGTDLP